MTKQKYIPVSVVFIFMLTSCLENPYNDLKYYYGNFKEMDIDQRLKDYSFLLREPVEITYKDEFSISDISCDTLGEITDHNAKEKLFQNIVLNGYHLYSSSLKVINEGNATQPRMLKPEEYYSQIDTNSFRYFINGEMKIVPDVRSFIVSENEKDRFCQIWLINISTTGEIISAAILAKYKEHNGSCFFTEKIQSRIKPGGIFNLTYESSAFATDAEYKKLKAYRKSFRLRLRITDTGEFVEK